MLEGFGREKRIWSLGPGSWESQLPGECGSLSKQNFLQDSFLGDQTVPQKSKLHLD